ncbi:hypothetical protein V6N13_148168 [Hibiscus sabdariffa]
MNVATGLNDDGCLNATNGKNDGSGPNITSGPNEGVDEVFYGELNDVDEDSSESDRVDGDNLLSNEEEERMVAIKNKPRLVEELGPDVVLEEIVHISIEENEDLRGLGSREETCYLDSSDVGSYETDSDGGIICKNSGKSTDPNGTFELMVERPTKAKIQDIVKFCRLRFFQSIRNDLNLGDGSKFTLISDMQKGLSEEVHQCLPNVEHRLCVRHMYAN